MILIFVVLILIVSAFKLNLGGYMDASPEQALDSNIVLIIQTGKIVWSDYIKGPLVTIWNEYIAPFARGDWLSSLRSREEARTTLPPE